MKQTTPASGVPAQPGEQATVVQHTGLPVELIEKALTAGADLEKLEKLLTLQIRWEENEAKKAYNRAMSAVSAKIPRVAKTLLNPQTHSKYAALDEIICTIKPIYTAEGLSVSFDEGETPLPDMVQIKAIVAHRLGHAETYHLNVPLDGKGIKGNVNMTPIHAKASSTKYAQRYLLCMIFNVPTGDPDDDGNAATPVEYISEEEAHRLVDKLIELEGDMAKFCDYLGIPSIPEMPKAKYQQALRALEAKQKKNK